MAKPRIGVLALARATFDVAYAERVAAGAFAVLDGMAVELVGPRDLLFDAASIEAALPALRAAELDLLLILQVTFTDATMTVAAANAVDAPLALWSFPEPRTGGRLRLNSLCGINLAGHALGRAGRACAFLHRAADDAGDDLLAILAGGNGATSSAAGPAGEAHEIQADARAGAVLKRLAESRIAVVGRHPDGFDTCRYDPAAMKALCGTEVTGIALDEVFAAADAVPDDTTATIRGNVAARITGMAAMEPAPLDGTLKVYAALKTIARDRGIAGFAVRCWPEFFTEHGCAACGAMSLLNDDMTPCGCEADVYGTLTTLALQATALEPAFIADLVDIDRAGDTGVFWHCGLAPLAMADPAFAPRAAVHSNRKKPLLMEFPLKPGRVTIARFSQARGRTQLMIGGAEMLSAPLAFSGTAGVVRFDRPAGAVLDTIMAEGLEHHYSLVYGDHRATLRALAARLDIPVLALC
ncbi:MAG: fucose isomerase [Alphaproteobacteria bacterium]